VPRFCEQLIRIQFRHSNSRINIGNLRRNTAAHLGSDETIAAYLSDVMESGDQKHIVYALNTVARAHGMTQIAQDAGIGRQALYKSLGESGNPTLATLLGVFKSLGLNLAVRT
jgi:probable addiction module antidote protein